MLGQVVYRSEAVFPEGHLSNLDILREALARNSGQGLTGFLMRDRTHFLQVIEGPMDRLNALLNDIARDSRHSTMVVLGREVRCTRLFGEWSMGYAEARPDAEPAIAALRAPEAIVLLRRAAARQATTWRLQAA